MVQIDGRMGEGGGQVLRTALALSACLGQPFRITHIRAGRRQPGLKAQHLTAVATVARICGAAVEGAELGSSALSFTPGPLMDGEYQVAVGTAGATTLVAQAALLPLLHAPGPARLWIDGGTHVAWSPPFEHSAELLLPLSAALGYPAHMRLERLGFYPRGGGRIELATPGRRSAALAKCLVLRRPPRAGICVRVTAVVSSLPRAIAERMVTAAGALLADHGWSAEGQVIERSGPTGTYAFIRACPVSDAGVVSDADAVSDAGAVGEEWIAGGFTGLGEPGKPAERVAREAAQEALVFLESEASLDARLADQILVAAALAGVELEFQTDRITKHLRTNADVIAHFRGPCVEIEPPGRVRVVPFRSAVS